MIPFTIFSSINSQKIHQNGVLGALIGFEPKPMLDGRIVGG